MGIYSGSERIDSVSVGSKDMVVLMQDNHILALGKKYWAVDLGTLDWLYNPAYGFICYTDIPSMNYNENYSTEKPLFYCSMYKTELYPKVTNGQTNMCISCSNKSYHYIVVSNSNYTNASEFKTAMSGVWLIYDYNRTLYDKVDLGSLNWNTSTNYRYNSTSLDTLAKKTSDNLTKGNIYCLSLATLSANDLNLHILENAISIDFNSNLKVFRSVEYFEDKSLEQFVNSIKGKELLYEVAE